MEFSGTMEWSRAPIPLLFQKSVLKAGAVEIVHGDDPILHLLGQQGRGVDGQVPALRVAAHDEAALIGSHGPQEISEGVRLGRDGVHDGHVKVFLPGVEGVVGAAKGDAPGPVRDADGQGGELLRVLVVVDPPIAGEGQRPEAGHGGQPVEALHDQRGCGHAQGRAALLRLSPIPVHHLF